MNQADFFKRLDDADDEQLIRNNLAAGHYTMGHDVMAREWLRIKEASRAEASADKSDSREERRLSIALETSASARAASKWAMYAAIIATTAIAIASKDHILSLLFP